MTFKERLQIEHPECVDGRYMEGCFRCPYNYGYEKLQNSTKNCKSNDGKGCEYCWNREIPVYDFKVGDKARLRDGLVVGCKYDGVRLLKEMTKLDEIVIDGIRGNIVDTNLYMYSKVMLEKVEERKDDMKKEFTKADLKDGMVVEYRNGRRRIVAGGVLYGIDGYTSLKSHHNDLTCSDGSLDIVKVYDRKECTLRSIFDYPGNLIWERKEEPVTKDVSLEEINALLKEKYPDVDAFNLPIKEK